MTNRPPPLPGRVPPPGRVLRRPVRTGATPLLAGPRFAAPAVLVALALALPAAAADVWTDPEPGLRHLHRTVPGPVVMEALYVDLCDPSIGLRATRHAERGQTPSGWGRQVGAIAAINGDYYSYSTLLTTGLAMGAGEVWPGTSDGSSWGLLAAGDDGRVELRPPAEALYGTPEPWMTDVVGGYPQCLVAGTAQRHTDSHYPDWHPRSAVGLTADGETLILLAVDGRSSLSRGATTQETGQFLADLGAWNGMNFDGGASTALWLATEGVVNQPSYGTERSVSNHLGIMRLDVPAGEPSRCCHPQAVAGATGTFADLPDGHWVRETAEVLYAAGVTRGCSADPRLFCPSCRATRAAAVAFLVRAGGYALTIPDTPTFSDVPAGHPLYAEIETAAAEGITFGCGGGRFCPKDPASRATVAVLAARTGGYPTAAPGSAPFADVPVDHFAAGALASLADACVVGGCGPDTFCPDRTATRAELAVMTARATGLVPVGCTPPTDGGHPLPDGGAADAGDGGAPDAGSWDAGGSPDAGGSEDAGPWDAGPGEDGGPGDGGPGHDAGPFADAGSGSDGGPWDAGLPDGGASAPDAGAPADGGEPDPVGGGTIQGGCGCTSAAGDGASAGLLALLGLVYLGRRSRRLA